MAILLETVKRDTIDREATFAHTWAKLRQHTSDGGGSISSVDRAQAATHQIECIRRARPSQTRTSRRLRWLYCNERECDDLTGSPTAVLRCPVTLVRVPLQLRFVLAGMIEVGSSVNTIPVLDLMGVYPRWELEIPNSVESEWRFRSVFHQV